MHANIYLKFIGSLKRKRGRGRQETGVLQKTIGEDSANQWKS